LDLSNIPAMLPANTRLPVQRKTMIPELPAFL